MGRDAVVDAAAVGVGCSPFRSRRRRLGSPMLRPWCAHRDHWSRGREQTCTKRHSCCTAPPLLTFVFTRALAAAQSSQKQIALSVGSDPHSLPQCIAASGHVSHATLPNPSRARGESAQNPCKKHAAKAKLAANRTDCAGAFQNTNPAARRRRARHSLLRANNWALATSCMVRAPRVAARALEVLQ